MIKKYLPLLIFGLVLFLPHPTNALSEACFPSVECDPGEDYYAGSCQSHIDTVALDCPGPGPGEFAAFSCDYGCYLRSTPDSDVCAGGVMVNGSCLTGLYLVDDGGTEKIWDGATLQNLDGDSLWSLNGSSVYYNDGNVGIGTDTPTASLQVEGGFNTQVLILNAGAGGGTALTASGTTAAILKGKTEVMNGAPLRMVADNVEIPGSRVGTFEADNFGNFIHIGSESNHDFTIVTNDQPRITITNLGDIGIGKTVPGFDIDADAAMNLDGNVSGGILYMKSDEAIWYNDDYVIWGGGANSNYFPKRVAIGSTTGSPSAQLNISKSSVSNTALYGINNSSTMSSGSGPIYGISNASSNNGTGTSYGMVNSASSATANAMGLYTTGTSQGEADAFGAYNYAYLPKVGNVHSAFGLYASAYNVSSSCAGPDCGDAYGVYATTGSSFFGTGVYGEGVYAGVQAVAKSGGTGIGLLVDNQQSGGIASLFKCTGNCTSAIFRDGNDASPGLFESGIVIIGQTNGTHLALDGNEIMAKTSANTAGTLYINKDGDGDVEVNMAHNSFASSVCRSGEVLGYCASLRDKKKNIEPLNLGLETVMLMKPVSFDWKEERVRDGQKDLGFIAEDTEAVSPLLAEYNEGELTGVKYTQYTAVLTKAIQEQQVMIEELKAVVCADHPETEWCIQ